MKISALVPMKGNSERVPGKNLRSFGGKPLFHAIVGTLAKSPYIDKIYINTDSEEIAGSAQEAFENVEIIWRPQEICGDFVSMNKVIEYDLSQIENNYFVQTHSTNPLLGLETFNDAAKKFLDGLDSGVESLFSVSRHQARFYDGQLHPVNHNPQELLRTQDLPPLFEENSNFYFFTRDSFLKDGKRIGDNPAIYEVPKYEAIDIDDEQDFILAESLYKTKL